jgi:hypothetical protein
MDCAFVEIIKLMSKFVLLLLGRLFMSQCFEANWIEVMALDVPICKDTKAMKHLNFFCATRYKSPTNPHWARVVAYGPFSLWVIHKEGLCPSNGDIKRVMMMML